MINFNEQKKHRVIAGVPSTSIPYFIAQSLKTTNTLNRSVLCILGDEENLRTCAAVADIFSLQKTKTLIFPEWDCLPYDKISPSFSSMGTRLSTLSRLLTNPCQVVFTTAKAISQLLPPTNLLASHRYEASIGTNCTRSSLLEYLINNGYSRVDTVCQMGEYAVRGGLIDIYPSNTLNPLRLDFFDESIESIKDFSAETQLSLNAIDSFELSPMSEVILTDSTVSHFRHSYRERFGTQSQTDPFYQAITNKFPFPGKEHWLPLFYETPGQLRDYLNNPLILYSARAWDGLESFSQKIDSYYEFRQEALSSHQDTYRPLEPKCFYAPEHILKKQCLSCDHVELTAFNPKGAEDFGARVLHTLSFKKERKKDTAKLLKQYLLDASKKVIFSAHTEGSLSVIKTFLESIKVKAETLSWQEIEQTDHKGPFISILPLSRGFDTSLFQIITEEDLYGARLSKKPKDSEKVKKKNLLEVAQFQEGDFLIHEEYGIGAYNGLVTLSIQEAQHDCVLLIYAEGDKLYVPVENLHLLSFYANKLSPVVLDRLGSSAWQARKARAQEKIKEIAEKLAKLSAQRQLIESNPYFPEHSFEEFCNRFPYPETEDQSRTIHEVVEDLSRSTPMDRLICGDVGFGKTEVALRAAFIVAMQKGQVAFLSPTTLLARQHFETFQHRFRHFPLKIELVSRFQSQTELRKIRDSLEKGEVDIIIGTHSLLSSSTKFNNLGLLIIDEEQHFGVTQKEKIKSLYPKVHILSLSATPIPRTLQMAIGGIRDLSLITTPPVERLPVHTWVMPYDGLTVKEALIRERQRGGQSFFVCPRIADISTVFHNLKELLPDFKFAIAHGSLSPKDLEQTMIDFCNRKYDVLIATNIIESGLDISSANTLIVYRSDLFGLAQIYQLRGRVGRSKAQGYAYFTFSQDKTLTQSAEQRLDVLQSLRSLGASFQVASHDMNIRGAGNILGEEQSGQVEQVGIGLYHHMLEEALAELRSNPDQTISLQKNWTPQISLGLEILIPPTYIADDSLRLSLYRRIADLSTEEEVENLKVEMVDRFGPLPQETINLLQTVSLRNLCKYWNIQKIESGTNGILVSFYKNIFNDPEKMLRFIHKSRGTFKLRPDQKLVILKVWKNPIHAMEGITELLEELKEA